MTIFIGADSAEFMKKLNGIKSAMRRGFGSETLALSKSIATGLSAAATAIGVVGLASIKMAADMEQNRIAFTTMLGSASAAESMLSDLAKFAEKTPFEFTGLVDSSKKLLAYGFTAQEIIPMMTSIGDAVAAFGGSADVLDRVTLAFGQMKAKGFVSGEEMRQLAEAGIPAWQMLANVIGKDIPTTMKLAEDKALNANAAIAGMLSQMTEKYGGMMEKQSQTITGMLSNIKDKGAAIMRQLGDEIVEALDLKTKLSGVMAFMDEFALKVKANGVRQAISEMVPPEVMLALYGIAGAITGAVVPAMILLIATASVAGVALWPFMLVGAALAGTLWVVNEAQKQVKDSSDALIATVDAECEGLSLEEAAALKAATGYYELAAAKRNASNVTAWERSMSGNEHRKPGEGSFLTQEPPPIVNPVAGKGVDKYANALQKLSEIMASLNEKILAVKGTEYEKALAGIDAEVVKLKNDLDDMGSLGIDTSSARNLLGQFETVSKMEASDKQTAALRKLLADTAVINAEITGDYQAAADAQYQIELLNIEDKKKALQKSAGDSKEAKQALIEWETNAVKSAQQKQAQAISDGDSKKHAAMLQLLDFQYQMGNLSTSAYQTQYLAEVDAFIASNNAKLKNLDEFSDAWKNNVQQTTEAIAQKHRLAGLNIETAWKEAGFRLTVNSFDYAGRIEECFNEMGTNISTALFDMFKGTGDGLKELFLSISDAIVKMWIDCMTQMYIMNPIKQMMGFGSGGGGNVFSSLLGIGKAAVSGGGAGAGGYFNNAQKSILSSYVPAFAGGGYNAGGWSLVGEEGPELVNFSRPGRVYNADDTKSALSGGGQAPHIVFNVNTPDAASFRKAQGQMLSDAYRHAATMARRNG